MLREIDRRTSLVFHDYGFKLVDVMSKSSHWAWAISNVGFDYSNVPLLKDYTYNQFTSIEPSIVITIDKDTDILTLSIENLIFDFAHASRYDGISPKGIVMYDDSTFLMRFNMGPFLDNLCNEIFGFALLDKYEIESQKVFSGNCRINFVLNSNIDAVNGIDSPTLYLDIIDNLWNNQINNMVFKSQDTALSYNFIGNKNQYAEYYLLQVLFNMLLRVKLKKNLKTNLKTKHIISPSKYNKINLGGEFGMLRNTYTSPYKRLECDIGSLDSTTIEKVGYIKVDFEALSNISKADYKVDSAYFHISVLNNDTLNILGYISVYFINKPYIKNMYDNYINVYVDMYSMFQHKGELNFNPRYIDKDFDYGVFSRMENKSRIYGHASLRYQTGMSDTQLSDNTVDIACMYVDSSNKYTFMLCVEDPLVCYCNIVDSSQLYENNKMHKLLYNFDVNIKYYSDVFTHELKKKL